MIALLNGKIRTVFDLVGEVQEELRSVDSVLASRSFSSLSFVRNGDLYLRESSFNPSDRGFYGDPVRSGQRLYFSRKSRLPVRFEHFLRLLRTIFPGSGFQALEIRYNGGELAVWLSKRLVGS